MKEKEKLTILVDDREGVDLVTPLTKLGVECMITRLSCGDYVCGDVVIERKTISDFCLSIIDGRLINQVEKMKEAFKHKYILISGKITEKESEINEKCVLGKIVSLVIKHKINVLLFDNDNQVSWVIKRIFERHQEICDEK